MGKGEDITDLLKDWNAGNQLALEQLVSVVHLRLKKLASSCLRTEEFKSLYSTDLVHEAFIALIEGKVPVWEDRAHFFGILAYLMRQVLMQHARKRLAQKRISPTKVSSAEVGLLPAPSRPTEFIQLEEALQTLESVDSRQCRIVELRYFGGLTIKETALALGCAESTVIRDWRLAKAWLCRELSDRRQV